jgi:hypothetical protein
MESEVAVVNNAMVTNLYKSAIEKSHIDFEDIPESKGDLTRYKGYRSMTESLELVKSIAAKESVKIPEIEIVQTAINNIVAFRESFEKGIRLNKDFIALSYYVLVQACVESTSAIIASYVDFVKRPDRVEFTIIRGADRSGHLSITTLDKFNTTVRTGEFGKALQGVISNSQEAFVGTAAAITTAVVIGSILVIVPLIRELVFIFYYSRMRASDYLEQQAALLEINKQNIASTNLPPKEKNQILKKQTATIAKLHNLSEKIKVNRIMAEKQANTNLQSENKNWSLDDVRAQAASTDDGGFQVL